MIYHYIKSFFLSITKNRFFYSINLIGFLTGFLVLTIILTFVYQELSFDKFHTNAANIYRINSGGYGLTPLCFGEKLNNQIPEISNVIRFSTGSITMVKNKEEINIEKIYYTDKDIFQVFSFNLISGNIDNALKAPFSIILNKSISNKLFGSNSPIGKTIKSKLGLIFTVTGVMEDIPDNSHIQSDAFASIETLRHTGDENTFNCGSWSILTYILLSGKSNVKETEEKINLLLEDSRMETGDGKIPLKLQSIKKLYFDQENNKYDGCKHGNIQTVIIYSAISVLLLLIVIFNYVNLSTAVSAYRIKEIAIKKINGAKRSQIIKQILLEALGVVFISYIIAILIIELLLPQLPSMFNLNISESLNRTILYLYFFIGVTIIGLLTGFFPGLFLSKINEIKALKNETFYNSRGIQRKLLLIFQLVIVALLLNSTFIINNQINYIFKKDLGFNYENVIYFKLNEELVDKKSTIKSNLLKNPKIEYVSFSTGLVGDGFGKAPIGNDENKKLCYFLSIDPDYMDLFKIEIKYGRNFSWDLKTDFENCCILNEKACKIFGIEKPINEKLGNKTVIGVVKDFNFTSLHNQIEPLVIYCEDYGNVAQVKISKYNQDETIHYIEKISKELSPAFNYNLSFINQRLKELYKSEFDLKSSFRVYSIITLIIASLGLFGLALFMIKKKTKEVSIRKLYGAKLNNTFMLLIKEYIRIVVISNLLAIPFTYFIMNNWLNNFQYKVDFGFFIFLKTFLLILLFTLMAISFMILKTHRINPMDTLKHE